MAVECKGDVTTVIESGSVKQLPEILIWTIGIDAVGERIDAALEKVYPEQYLRFKETSKIILLID